MAVILVASHLLAFGSGGVVAILLARREERRRAEPKDRTDLW